MGMRTVNRGAVIVVFTPCLAPTAGVPFVGMEVPVEIPAFNVSEIEEYLVVRTTIIADLVIAHAEIALVAAAVKMTSHIDKCNIWMFAF